MYLKKPTHTHSTERDGKRYIWYTERLWLLAKDLPEYEADVEHFEELDRDCWFGERQDADDPGDCRTLPADQ